MARCRLSVSAAEPPARSPFTSSRASGFDSPAPTAEFASFICTLAMPAPVPTGLPASVSVLVAPLPSATASCRLPSSTSVLLATGAPPPLATSQICEPALTAATPPP